MEARNDLGVGEPSPRIVFRTANRPQSDRELPKDSYNVTSCCVNAGVMEDCEQNNAICPDRSDLTSIDPLSGFNTSVVQGDLSDMRPGLGQL